MNKKALSVLVILAMLLIMLPVSGIAAAEYNVWVNGTQINSLNDENVLGDGKVSYVHNDETGEGTLTLNGANITTTTASPISIASGATVNITLIGTNTLTTNGENFAGLNVPAGATVTISGAGSLNATGGNSGAGIGGNNTETAGTITISGGTVTASGGSYGIAGNNIIISAGTVTAKGDDKGILFGTFNSGDYHQISFTASDSYWGIDLFAIDYNHIHEYKYLKIAPAVAEIGSVGYSTLQDAINAVTEGQTIKMLADITSNQLDPNTIIDSRNVSFTLDLNGKKLQHNNSSPIRHLGSGTLTIQDTGTGGAVIGNWDTATTIMVSGNGTINLLSGTIKVETSGNNGSTAISVNSGRVNIQGGTVVNNGNGFAVYANSQAEVTISDNAQVIGSNTDDDKGTIRLYRNNTLTLKGGIIYNDNNGKAITVSDSSNTINVNDIPSGNSVIVKGGTAITQAPIVSGASITASTNYDGTSPVTYNASNISTYKYLKFEPTSIPDAPGAPILVSKTHNTVTLTANATYEFSKDGSTWQTSEVFTGLTGNTEYTFYQRVAATGGTPASEASVALSVTTEATPAFVTVPYSENILSEGHHSPMNIISGSDGKLYVSEYYGNKVIKIDKDGSNQVIISTDFNQPIGMCFDSAGNLFVAENAGRRISKIDSSGSKSLIKNMDKLMAGIVFDSYGKLYAVNYQDGYIYKMDGDGTNQSTFANLGSGTSVIGLAVDNEDNIYASSRIQNKIVKVTPDGTMTDFTTVSFPNWVSIGKDGYLYASSGDRSIQKFDLSGTKLAVYQTGSFSPWGTWISPSGYIYFTEGNSRIIEIVGYGETTNKTQINITLNSNLANGIADPSAFTLSGVASNPQVTGADISGSNIILTLDSEVASSDTNIKVNYTKTGTNNIVISGTSTEIDNFSNLTIVNNIKSISSVGAIANITVANGTSIESIGLPSTVNITLSDSTTTNLSVSWDGGMPAYSRSTAGTYTFTGTLNVTNSIDNPLNRIASVDVVVGAAPGGGDGSSDNDSSPAPTNNPVEVIITPPAADRPTAPTQGEIRVPASMGNNGNGTVQITNEILNHAFERTLEDARRNGNEGNGIDLVLRVDTGNSSLSNILVNLPKTVQDAIIERQIINTIVVVQNPDIRIGMDLNTVRQINNQANTDVNITANRRDNNNLPEEARDAVGNRPVFDLRVNYGSTGRVQNFGDGSVTVTIPYTLGANEKPENVQAVYVDEDGKLHWLPNSVYDSVEKVVRFSTSHFSIYGVGYKEEAPVITDISNHWAKNDIDFVMNKGLLVGTSPTTFGPNTGMTRGMFVTVLGRLAEADVDAYKTSSFTDVKSDAYYMSSVEWAKEKGIVSGMGEGRFAPEQTITREQMAAIILNYAEFINFKLPKVNGEKTFADNDKISSYAKDSVSQVQMAGVIGGKNGNVFDPQGTATRAEFSSVLRRFVELVDQLKK